MMSFQLTSNDSLVIKGDSFTKQSQTFKTRACFISSLLVVDLTILEVVSQAPLKPRFLVHLWTQDHPFSRDKVCGLHKCC